MVSGFKLYNLTWLSAMSMDREVSETSAEVKLYLLISGIITLATIISPSCIKNLTFNFSDMLYVLWFSIDKVLMPVLIMLLKGNNAVVDAINNFTNDFFMKENIPPLNYNSIM